MKILSTIFVVAFTSLIASGLETINSQVSSRRTDLTLVSGASGVEVVDACIQKLKTIPAYVFANDYGFMKRVALVESAFGTNATIMNAFPKGGIWQITSDIRQTVSEASESISSYLTVIEEILGSDIVNFTSHDFSVPLKSALAARIFIELTSQGILPGSLDEQGQWWATNYHNGSDRAAFFISTVQVYEDVTRCKVSKLDLWFLIDGSGSIGQEHFTTCLEFVDKTAAKFPISADEVRTGLMVYSSSTKVISRFNQHLSNEAFSNVVLQTAYPEEGTYTGAAISKVQKNGFKVNNGARSRSEAVPRILIVLTDGRSADDVKEPSDNIKEAGVTVFGVGVGGFDKAEINEIASDPDSEYAFEFTDFAALASVLQERVASQACTVPAVIPDDTSVSVVIEARSTFYSQISLPSNGSVELVYEMSFTASIGIVYVSDSVANPSKALFDASFDVNVGVTTMIINSGDLGGPPELVNKRKRRATPELESTPIYVAFVSQSDTPVNLNFTAKSSPLRATAAPITTTSGAASGGKNVMLIAIIVLLILSFACIYI